MSLQFSILKSINNTCCISFWQNSGSLQDWMFVVFSVFDDYSGYIMIIENLLKECCFVLLFYKK